MTLKRITVEVEPRQEISHVHLRVLIETCGDCHAEERNIPIDHFQSMFRICMEEATRRIEDKLKIVNPVSE